MADQATTVDYKGLVAGQRAYFKAGTTRPAAWRIEQLNAIRAMIDENRDDMYEALWHDLWPAVNELNIAACARLPEGGAAMLRWLLGEMRISLDDMIEKRKPPRNLRRGDAE